MSSTEQQSRIIRNLGKKSSNKKSWKRHTDFEEKKSSKLDVEDGDKDYEVCLICADRIIYACKTPCSHTTCHICTFRQRALYGKRSCLICRTENDVVLFTETIDGDYKTLSEKPQLLANMKYAINFTSKVVEEATLGLLDFKCTCGDKFENYKQLTEHSKSAHNKYYCNLCYKYKNAFVCELEVFTHKQLQKHQAEGDKVGFSGHPECKHCKGKRFYSEDELNIHIRDRHERCHICDQHTPKTADYYKDYDALYEHFKIMHFVCTVPSCLDKKFVVFRDDLELTSHMLKEHGGITGMNNRVVIGSNTSHFQTRLSTFNNSRSVNRDGSDTASETDSLTTKKKRLEERAKHYLNYDMRKMKEFEKINSDYKSGLIDSENLVEKYKILFASREKNEIQILAFEFAELFPKNSEKRKAFDHLTERISNIITSSNFPVLGGSTSKTNSDFHSWGSPVSSSNSSEEKFPVLSRPKKNKSVVDTNVPIRYTVLKKSTSGAPSISVNKSQADLSYKPTYLNNSEGSSQGLKQVRSTPALSKDKFPALSKVSAKKVFPRVNPVDLSSSQWNKNSPESSPMETINIEDISQMDKRKQKQRKKQEKILLKTL